MKMRLIFANFFRWEKTVIYDLWRYGLINFNNLSQ